MDEPATTTSLLGVRLQAGRIPGVTDWTPRSLATEAASQVAFAALFPRWSHRARWVSRLRPRGLLLYVGLRTAERYVTLTWVVPGLLGVVERKRQWREELADRLGREPSEAEVRHDAQRRARELHPRP